MQQVLDRAGQVGDRGRAAGGDLERLARGRRVRGGSAQGPDDVADVYP
ncbi:hypothetical protein [Rhodovibrio sodomensis]